MTEALAIAPGILDGRIPRAPALPSFEIPFHLRRRTLKAIRREEGVVPEKLWSQRARKVEEYVQDVIASQTNIVESVMINPEHDAEGPDLTLKLVNGLVLKVEVKSSTQVIRNYKLKIRDSLPEGERDMEHVTKLLVDRNIILINGGTGEDDEEKTKKEILDESFYPQLKRILSKRLADSMSKHYLSLSSSEPTQLFP